MSESQIPSKRSCTDKNQSDNPSSSNTDNNQSPTNLSEYPVEVNCSNYFVLSTYVTIFV